MKTLSLLFLATALAACDSSEPGICLIGPETEVDGDIHVQITSPANGDTLRVGQSFRFRGEVEATGDVSVLGVRLANEDLGFLPNTALFERDLGYGAGTYVIDEEVVLDSIRAGADLSEVYVLAFGRVLNNTACGGAYGGAGSKVVQVTVLE